MVPMERLGICENIPSICFMCFTSIQFFHYVNIRVQAYITNGSFGTQRPYP